MIVTTRYPEISITIEEADLYIHIYKKIMEHVKRNTPMMSILVSQLRRWRLILSTSVCPYLQIQSVLRTEIVNRISMMQSRKKTLSKQTSKHGSSQFDAGAKIKAFPIFFVISTM